MGLFSSLNTGVTALNAQQAALQTIGHNVANANTPGFSRQRADLVAQPPQDLVFAQLGRGVRLSGIRRLVDEAIETRLQNAKASLGDAGVRDQTLRRLEGIFDALGENGLDSSLDAFFASIEDLAQRPDDGSTRRAVLTQAQSLSDGLSSLARRIRETRESLDTEIPLLARQVNEIAAEVAELNQAILVQENGGVDAGAANDLRDRRGILLQQLAELAGVRAIETPRGDVNVLAGSEFLVFGGEARALTLRTTADRGSTIQTPVFESTGAALTPAGGRLRGLLDARDGLLPGYYDDVNELARTLVFEFNRAHAQGQGLTRFSRLTSLNAAASVSTSVLPGTVTAGTSTTVFADAGLIGAPDLTGRTVLFLSGANALQERRITAFDTVTGEVTVAAAFGAIPAAGDTFQVVSPLPLAIAGSVTAGTSDSGFRDASLVGFPDLTGQNVVFQTGANRFQSRRIIAFDGVTGTINLDRAFDQPVRAGDAFQVTALDFPVVNGSFEVVVTDELTGTQTATRVTVDLDKLLPDATLESIRAQIDAVANVDAAVTADRKLEVATTSSSLTFHFANDTSGFLAAFGMNAMFAGTDAETMGVNPLVAEDPSLLAAGRSIAEGDNANALAMGALRDALVVAEGTMTFEDFYQGIAGALAIDTASAADRLQAQQSVAEQLANERERVSGVNIDEEVVQMITFQRAFQASARFIGVIDNLLETLLTST